ncbi:hypothetical protein ACWDX8_13455 [Streptomyces anthocyanicus]|uniref:hypothetical protein n=1 Tax=Streptomyces TaxID=1883 RepID=UPI000EF5BB56|nr:MULTISPECIES: hypothetical protein [unclassified Streptomyces]MDX3405559.1 hypothetical protein [Streptomyces sp. ME02-6977A]
MESQRCWLVESDDLPDGHVLVPVKTKDGLALACRPGEMSKQMFDDLNAAARHLIGVGIVTINDNDGKPPERRE